MFLLPVIVISADRDRSEASSDYISHLRCSVHLKVKVLIVGLPAIRPTHRVCRPSLTSLSLSINPSLVAKAFLTQSPEQLYDPVKYKCTPRPVLLFPSTPAWPGEKIQVMLTLMENASCWVELLI